MMIAVSKVRIYIEIQVYKANYTIQPFFLRVLTVIGRYDANRYLIKPSKIVIVHSYYAHFHVLILLSYICDLRQHLPSMGKLIDVSISVYYITTFLHSYVPGNLYKITVGHGKTQ